MTTCAVDAADLPQELRHVLWIGGGSGAGKSTIARRLADQHSLRLYGTDDVMAEHAARCTPASAPRLREFAAMSMDQRWVERSPQQMLDTFHWFRGEGFGCIVEDLRALPHFPRVLVEGFRLLPDLVAPLLTDPASAVWLLPTPAFRRAAFASRGSLWTIAERTSDPDRALANLLERDALFTDQVARSATAHDLATIDIDTATTPAGLLARVAAALQL